MALRTKHHIELKTLDGYFNPMVSRVLVANARTWGNQSLITTVLLHLPGEIVLQEKGDIRAISKDIACHHV